MSFTLGCALAQGSDFESSQYSSYVMGSIWAWANVLGINPESPTNSACRRCSNYIFILDLKHAFIELSEDNCKTRQETFKFGICTPALKEPELPCSS